MGNHFRYPVVITAKCRYRGMTKTRKAWYILLNLRATRGLIAVVRIVLSTFRKHPIRHKHAKSTFPLDAFALSIPIRKSVKRTSELRRGGTAKIFMIILLKLQQLFAPCKKNLSSPRSICD
jgi:hypothetical protein